STVQPFRYITDVASTNTFRSSKLKILSITPGAFSKDMEYENPEQPPPTTPMRSPAGAGSCCFMISLTLETAVEVRLMGVFGVVSTLGVVVEAIQNLLHNRVFGIKTIIVQIHSRTPVR